MTSKSTSLSLQNLPQDNNINDSTTVKLDPNKSANTNINSICHISNQHLQLHQPQSTHSVHFIAPTKQLQLTDLNPAQLNPNKMSQNYENNVNLPSTSTSSVSSTSNHHYLYQIQRQSQVNRSPSLWQNSHLVSVVPDATSIVSASSSSGNGSNDVETVTTTTTINNRRFCCLWYQKMFTIAPDSDKRLARSYPSFIIGRFLGILSSISLLIGFLVKFFFMNESSSFGSIISYVIIGSSVGVFAIAAILVIWATVYKSAKARREFLESKHPTLTPTEPPFLKQLYKKKTNQIDTNNTKSSECLAKGDDCEAKCTSSEECCDSRDKTANGISI